MNIEEAGLDESQIDNSKMLCGLLRKSVEQGKTIRLKTQAKLPSTTSLILAHSGFRKDKFFDKRIPQAFLKPFGKRKIKRLKYAKLSKYTVSRY